MAQTRGKRTLRYVVFISPMSGVTAFCRTRNTMRLWAQQYTAVLHETDSLPPPFPPSNLSADINLTHGAFDNLVAF
jgi:hypothetical protein